VSAPGDAGPREIAIRGAREHNLRGVDVSIPRDRLVVITGLSGSGKSSLAFDTLYAEGQRRYVESLSVYARQFLDQLAKPDVESIEGLSPAISIEQRTVSRNPRSTVGTATEIGDHLRLLYARVGEPHCWICGRPIASQTIEQMADRVLGLPEGTRVQLLAPLVRGRKGAYKKELEELRRQGFARVRVDGVLHELGDELRLERQAQHDIDVVVDRIAVRPSARARLAESIETALRLADGLLRVDVGPGREEWLLSEANACAQCGVSFPEITPRLFSFNGPHGACPRCDGLGTRDEFDPERVVPDPGRPLGGAIAPWAASAQGARAASQRRAKFIGRERYYAQLLASLARHFDVSLETPWRELPEAARRGILHGTEAPIELALARRGKTERVARRWDGVIGELERRRETASGAARAAGAAQRSEAERRSSSGKASGAHRGGEELLRFTRPQPCAECGGSRLRREARAVRLGGLGIDALGRLSIAETAAFLDAVALPEAKRAIAERILREVRDRLRFMVDVGLDYLTLDRASATLSGGEGQRIRLATQVGASLLGVLYVLDEPSIGLHPRDNRRLLASLARLRDQGNSVIVVEHDEETIRAADWVLDMGPGAGIHGGELVAEGPPAAIAADPRSLTGDYLAGRRRIAAPRARRAPSERWLVLRGCSEHNLRSIDFRVPLGLFTAVTGVSGSGKSTLVTDTLFRALAQRLHGAQQPAGRFASIEGLAHVDKVIDVDQSPIGRTPRSNPATYAGALDGIRKIFSQVPEARVRGYDPGRFSFNVKGGRCEACQGDGMLRVEMHFLPDVFVVCEVCRGRRYNRETLEVRYKGKTIADVLELSVEEALPFFERFDAVERPLRTLSEVGLGYLHLGQAATTLSGGEAQRIKLSRELARRGTGSTVYILDEPTTGLHFADVERLLGVLQRLVELGNTVIVIEHHLDVVKSADWVIDLGPEGGARGGAIVAEGPPEQIAAVAASHTGRALSPALAR